MALKKREFTPESGSFDTYEFVVRNGISRIVKMLKLVCALAIGEAPIAVICVTKRRTGDYDFRACARARGFPGSTFSVGRIRFAVCAERSRDKTCVF